MMRNLTNDDHLVAMIFPSLGLVSAAVFEFSPFTPGAQEYEHYKPLYVCYDLKVEQGPKPVS